MNKHKIKILLAAPRGFCAGVDRAIEIVKKSIDKFGAPVYVRHEIVHNKHVVESLKEIGAIFVEELSEIKDKTRPVIFSAHGVPKSVPEEAEGLKMTYVDATCPLVSKVHREAENLHKAGNHILLIGHKNHPEVIGTIGQLPNGSIDLIESIEDVENYKTTKIEKVAFMMIFGGSIGNIFDRLYYSSVPDFIDFHINNFHWFIFNVADIFITLGVILLIILEFFPKKKI